MKRSSKKVLIISLIIALILAIVLVALFLFMKKSNKVFLKGDSSFKLDFTDKFVEDEFQKVTVTDISVAENYYFIKYDVSLKDKGKKALMVESNNAEDFSYQLSRTVTINGLEIDKDTGSIYQISEKINEDTLRVYDIIKVDSIPDKFNISIDFIKLYEEEQLSEEQLAEDRKISIEHETSSLDVEGDFEGKYTDPEAEDEIIEVSYDDEEDAIPLEMEVLDESIVEIEMAGTTSFQGTKQEASQNVEIQYLKNKGEDTDIAVNPQFIAKTPYNTFLVVTTNLENLYQDENKPNDPFALRMDVQDKEGNTQNVKFAQNHNIEASRKL